MKIQTDVVIDVSRGDAGKAKVVHSLLKEFSNLEYSKYNLVTRFNGSANAGHTLYHNGQKFITHMIPAGIFFNTPCLIGNNCVVHPESLLKEINELQKQFNQTEELKHIDISSLIKIDANTFLISDEHLKEDSTENKVGSTKRGVGPAVRDKYARVSTQAKNNDLLKPFLVDTYEFLNSKKNWKILCEGAQGFYLDPHFAEYPYCTSTHCSIGSVFLNGIPPRSLRTVWGVGKVYETYVGLMKFQPEGEIFNKIADLGGEVGSTTGRRRQCRWLNMNELIKACQINDVDILVLNKLDVLEQVNEFKLTYNDVTESFATSKDFCNRVEGLLNKYHDCEIIFSSSPHKI